MAWAVLTLVTLLHGCCTGGFCSEPDMVRADLYKRRLTAGAEQLHLVAMDCHDGDAQACLALGTVYENGIDVPASQDRARDAFRAACALDPNHCHGEKRFEYEVATLRTSERACAAGDNARACAATARMYLEGHIAAQDVKHARALYERACPADRGPRSDAADCSQFAYMLLTGWGGPKDEQRALGLLTHGSPYETFAVELGLGVPKDLSAAHDQYERLCDPRPPADGRDGGDGECRSPPRQRRIRSPAIASASCTRKAAAPARPRPGRAPLLSGLRAGHEYLAERGDTNRVVMELACSRGAVLFLQNDVDPFGDDWNGLRGVPVLHARRMLELGCHAGSRASCRALRQIRSALGDAVIVEDPRQ